MEEQKKEETKMPDTDLEVQEEQDNTVGEQESGNQEGAFAGMPTRSYMLWVLAGLYLSYTGFRLCKNVIDGVEGASMGFMLAGIGFLALGVALLFFGGRGVYRRDRLKKAEEAAAAANPQNEPAPVPEKEAEAPLQEGPKKKMSIAERARLAERLEDEEESEDTEE